jgi:glutaminase
MDPITGTLERIHAELAGERGGQLADYIPELAAADPDRFGLALVSMGGTVYRAGDAEPFTIQSVSKPFVHALALADNGLDAVLARVSAEPSGEPFNAVSIEPGTGRPANPMINAGAILTTSLVAGSGPGQRFARIHAALSAFAGRELAVDEATFASERATGDRNRALAYLMRAAGSLTEPVEDACDTYFRQCSVLVTTADIATMAATLANGGVNPRTGERVVGEREAGQVLTVMATCGMYDYSGEWLLRAGLPAKSGVSGCVVAASPAQFGIGLFSPPVDPRGNSVRAVRAARRITEAFELDLVRHAGLSAPVIRRRGDGSAPAAGRLSPSDTELLGEHGRRIAVLDLQGELDFAAAELVVAELLGLAGSGVRLLLLDLALVWRMRPVAAGLIGAALTDLAHDGVRTAVAGPAADQVAATQRFTHIGEALKWCEDTLLAEVRRASRA